MTTRSQILDRLLRALRREAHGRALDSEKDRLATAEMLVDHVVKLIDESGGKVFKGEKQ